MAGHLKASDLSPDVRQAIADALAAKTMTYRDIQMLFKVPYRVVKAIEEGMDYAVHIPTTVDATLLPSLEIDFSSAVGEKIERSLISHLEALDRIAEMTKTQWIFHQSADAVAILYKEIATNARDIMQAVANARAQQDVAALDSREAKALPAPITEE